MSGSSFFESYAYQRISEAISVEASPRYPLPNPPHVMSLFVSADRDDPAEPRIALSFEYPPEPEDGLEVLARWRNDAEWRWNYAAWGQDLSNVMGEDDESRRAFATMFAGLHINDYDHAVVSALIAAVQRVHRDRLIEQHLAVSSPILIHELEYSQRIAEWNVEANGLDRVRDFVEWIGQYYRGEKRAHFDELMLRADSRYQQSMTKR